MQDIAMALTGSLPRDGSGGMQADLPMGGHKITGAAPGVNPTDVATVSQLVPVSGIPVGTVVDFAGSPAPSGWLVCAGQSVNRTDYPDLFTAIGTTFGSASGSTFNLPDCRGRVSAGVDSNVGGFANRLTALSPNGTIMGATGGTEAVTLTAAQLAAHSHGGVTGSAGDHSHTTSIPAIGVGGSDNPSQPAWNVRTFQNYGPVPVSTSADGAHIHSIPSDGGGGAHSNTQPTILFSKIIKATANG